MSRTLAEDLHVQLLALPFHAFEGCLCDLLSAMSYEEVTLLRRTQTRQFTNHGGRDMEAYTHTGITRARLVLQAKQYRRPVSRRFVDELRGTALRLGAGQGLLITTSTFSTVARRAADTSVAPVQLMDGETLVRLLIKHRIGVAAPPRSGKESACLDEAYFTRLRERFPEQQARRTVPAPVSTVSSALVAVSLPYHLKRGTMLWRTHVCAGVNTLWLFQPVPGVLTPETFPLLSVLAAFGALLPDLDASASKINSLSLGDIRPFAPFSVIAHHAFGHRGFLHSPGALFLLALLLLPFAFRWGLAPPLAVWMGYLSHLLLDACTPVGLPRYRVRSQRFHLLPTALRVRTGAMAEDVLLALLLVSAFALALSQLLALLRV
jgi:inner membrane protein